MNKVIVVGVAAAGGVGVVIGQHDKAPSRAEIF